ncbi:MAG: hypothetical protein IJW37_10645 [Lachnospiraceae bacterium]|nr:hypothetical protein [Lachnospiraceae bacterium]
MNENDRTRNSNNQRQILLSLCRLIALRQLHKGTVLLLFATGLLLSFLGHSQFAPYGIALIYLLLPTFIQNSAQENTKKENSDSPLALLCGKYHYSLSAFFSYRISFLACSILLFCWHMVLKTPLTLGNISLPLLYLAFHLALYPILARIRFLQFHRRLMDGDL